MPHDSFARLRLHLLGEVRVTLNGQPLPGKIYGKLLGLLAFLAVESNRSHGREQLAELLWPEMSAEAARNNLRQTLYNLRRAVDEESNTAFIVSGRETVRFQTEGCWLDLRDFLSPASLCPTAPTAMQCADCLAGMERRAALYRGEFLAGLTVDGAPPFEDWRAAWREQLHRQALALLERLRLCHERQGALDRALAAARRYTELEPWDEQGHRQVMRLLALTGHRGAALAQYEACRAMLQRDVGIAPEMETQDLAAAIRNGRFENARVAQAPAREIPQLGNRERRPVTVLYCTFTVPGEEDPDEIAEQIRLPQQEAIAIVRHQGAHLAPAHGGALLAYFGYPAASEDAARRAVRAALALSKLDSKRVTLRVGVHTGIIITGNDPHLPDTVGVASKVAMRLCDRAAAGAVVVSHVTQRLVAGYFHQLALEPQRLSDGTDPIGLFRITGETGASGRLDAAARLVPLVGRREELEQIKSLWAKTQQGRSHHVVVRGEAGIGKSRLLRALCESIAGDAWALRELHCFPEYGQTPLYPVVTLLERLLAFAPDDGPELKRERLDTYLRAHHSELRDEAYPLVAALLGIGEATQPMTPELQKERSLGVLLKLLANSAQQQPLLLAVEDIHWIDPSTLELLELAIKSGSNAPILSIYTTRPKLTPEWLLEKSVVIDLAPLGDGEMTALVREAEADLPSETVRRIVSRADGVPLFAEEMAHMAIEADVGNEIPATLHFLLLARLDAMQDERRIAQIAATIGREFDRPLLRQVAEVDELALDRALQSLHERRLIAAGGDVGAVLQFRHALIQEAAYQSQTKADRQAAHRRIAHALLTRFPTRATAQPEQVARHFTAAGTPTDAIPWWLAAGRGALRALANAEAAEHLRAGLALIETLQLGRERDVMALELLLPLGQALLRLRGYGSADAVEVYDRAFALRDAGDAVQRFEALWGLWMVSSSRPESSFDESTRLARELLDAAQATDHPVLLSYAHSAAANVALWQGELERACDHAEAAVAASTEAQRREERLDGHDPCVASLGYLAWARVAQGRKEEALAASERAIAIARRLDQPDSLGFALVHAGIVHRLLHNVPAVAQFGQETLALATQYSLPLWQGAAALMLGWAQSFGGDRSGLDLLNASAAGVRQIMPGILVAFLHPLAEAYGVLGESEMQLQVVEEALQSSARLHDYFHLADLYRLKSEALARLGRRAEALEAVRSALQLSQEQGAELFRLRAVKILSTLGEESIR